MTILQRLMSEATVLPTAPQLPPTLLLHLPVIPSHLCRHLYLGMSLTPMLLFLI